MCGPESIDVLHLNATPKQNAVLGEVYRTNNVRTKIVLIYYKWIRIPSFQEFGKFVLFATMLLSERAKRGRFAYIAQPPGHLQRTANK
jgi:hypothetical protein